LFKINKKFVLLLVNASFLDEKQQDYAFERKYLRK